MGRTVMRRVQVELSTAEVAKKAGHLADVLTKADEVTEAKKAKSKEFSGVLDSLDAGARLLRAQISEKREVRQVECWYQKDYRQGIVRFYRAGTGDLVETRGMTDEERQQSLTDDSDFISTSEADEELSRIMDAFKAPPADPKSPQDPSITEAKSTLQSIFGEQAVIEPEDERDLKPENTAADKPASAEPDDEDDEDDDGRAPGEAF